jgi:1-deoxy-D-xylulose-5-phosphate reductoisomerase
VAVLGSTGSIGEQALDVIRRAPERFRVVALAAGRSADKLAAQARELRPAVVGLVDEARGGRPGRRAAAGCRLAVGPRRWPSWPPPRTPTWSSTASLARSAWPRPCGALGPGAASPLANKESLIVGGELVTGMAKPGQTVPVDSGTPGSPECLRAGRPGR